MNFFYSLLPPDASTHGHRLDYWLLIVHILMAVLFIGWGIYFFLVLFKFRAARNPVANYHGVKSHLSSYLEAAVAIFEAFLLLAFAYPIWAEVKTRIPDESGMMRIDIVAEQFNWNIHYPGADGVFGRRALHLVSSDNPLGLDRGGDPAAKDDIAAINQLHVPVGKPVMIHLSSKDVIHSLSLPTMRVKQDVIPGILIPVWFTPKGTGKWEISCAQLCGLGHYRMRGYFVVETQAEWDAWMAEQATYLQ